MIVRPFADTNIVVYAQSNDGDKSAKALALLETSPVISSQVVNETVAVLTRKHAFSLAARYQLPHWDALIVSAALRADCDTLFSEDFQDGQIFNERLTVRSPFRD